MVMPCVLGCMDSSLAATSTALRSFAIALSRPSSSHVPGVWYKLASLYQVYWESLLQVGKELLALKLHMFFTLLFQDI